MATLRQKGAPTLFLTFSCAEYDWEYMIKSVYETVHKKTVSIEEIRNLTPGEKSKLVSENVCQTTIHFSKRTDKLMSILKQGGIFVHDGIDYKVDSFFYRVEYQARGAPHIHSLLWLKDEDGKSPPSMWNQSMESKETVL